MFHLLKNAKILTIDARNLLSYRKKNNKLILQKLKQVHPQVDLESHLFNIVHEHRDNLRKLIQRKRSKKKRRAADREGDENRVKRYSTRKNNVSFI